MLFLSKTSSQKLTFVFKSRATTDETRAEHLNEIDTEPKKRRGALLSAGMMGDFGKNSRASAQ